MARSLGAKRRILDSKTIEAVSKEHGAFKTTETSKIFDNIDFGYRRITVERPLRLRFQITTEAKATFLNQCPELFDAVQEMEEELGGEANMDWNSAWIEIQRIVKNSDSSWDEGATGTKQKDFFRYCFTVIDPAAAPVIAKRGSFTGFTGKGSFPGQILTGDLEPNVIDQIFGTFPETKGKKGKAIQYEADSKLRDNENVPLKENVVSFFLREVRPYFADAWINADPKLRDEKDGGIGKVGFEINFNRSFFTYNAPRSLKVIDEELANVEAQILKMLKEVTT
jgi:type I restriction enzyme M protein